MPFDPVVFLKLYKIAHSETTVEKRNNSTSVLVRISDSTITANSRDVAARH